MTKASNEITVDRRDETPERRDTSERRAESVEVNDDRRSTERRKVQRRRQIDPTTCERDYTNDEIEFMQAMDAYKRASGRMFPTCSEILEVVRSLGYFRLVDGEFVEEAIADDDLIAEEQAEEEEAIS